MTQVAHGRIGSNGQARLRYRDVSTSTSGECPNAGHPTRAAHTPAVTTSPRGRRHPRFAGNGLDSAVGRFGELGQRLRDLDVPTLRSMLIDQGSAWGAVAEPAHQFGQRRARLGGHRRGGVAQVVEP